MSRPASNAVRTALFAVATLGLVTAAATQSAEARHRHGPGLSIHLGSGHIGFGHRSHHHHLLLVDGRGCRWLYRKAVRTGSAYWWDRYEGCRYGY
ncbi:MAG: hypothetical protein ABL897_06940 [Hyphomicrobium sp.]